MNGSPDDIYVMLDAVPVASKDDIIADELGAGIITRLPYGDLKGKMDLDPEQSYQIKVSSFNVRLGNNSRSFRSSPPRFVFVPSESTGRCYVDEYSMIFFNEVK